MLAVSLLLGLDVLLRQIERQTGKNTKVVYNEIFGMTSTQMNKV